MTYELWLEKKTLTEIGLERKLTQTTVEGHIARLVEEGKILITDVLSKEKIDGLALVFEDYTGGGLADLKEKVGEKFSYGELRIFKATLS